MRWNSALLPAKWILRIAAALAFGPAVVALQRCFDHVTMFAATYLCGRGPGLKIRGWLLLLIFAHVMLHPWVHAIGLSRAAATATSISSVPADQGFTTTAADQCELCRVGHNATVIPQLPRLDLLNPGWILTALHAVNYDSLQADQRRPSRAPPVL